MCNRETDSSLFCIPMLTRGVFSDASGERTPRKGYELVRQEFYAPEGLEGAKAVLVD